MCPARARRSTCVPRRARSCTTRCAPWWARSRSWARGAGAPTILPRRLRQRTALAAARWRRPAGFICCGWITNARNSLEIVLENLRVNLLQHAQVLHRNALVDGVHAAAAETDVDHGAIVLDEARVGRAARS